MQHTLWWLDTNALEERGVTQRKLDQFTNLSELLAHTTDIIVANVVEPLLIVALDGVALAVDDGVGSDDAVRRRIGLDNLELHSTHATTNQEIVTCKIV